MKYRMLCFGVIGVICTLVSACGNSSPYRIDKIKSAVITEEYITGTLGDETVDIIEEFIPKVVDWYNDIDITEPLMVDFVDDEIDELGSMLLNDDRVRMYMDSYGTVNEDIFEVIFPASSIYGEISGIMMTSEITYDLTNDEDPRMIISEDDWVELGNTIKEAIEFYY